MIDDRGAKQVEQLRIRFFEALLEAHPAVAARVFRFDRVECNDIARRDFEPQPYADNRSADEKRRKGLTPKTSREKRLVG